MHFQALVWVPVKSCRNEPGEPPPQLTHRKRAGHGDWIRDGWVSGRKPWGNRISRTHWPHWRTLVPFGKQKRDVPYCYRWKGWRKPIACLSSFVSLPLEHCIVPPNFLGVSSINPNVSVVFMSFKFELSFLFLGGNEHTYTHTEEKQLNPHKDSGTSQISCTVIQITDMLCVNAASGVSRIIRSS